MTLYQVIKSAHYSNMLKACIKTIYKPDYVHKSLKSLNYRTGIVYFVQRNVKIYHTLSPKIVDSTLQTKVVDNPAIFPNNIMDNETGATPGGLYLETPGIALNPPPTLGLSWLMDTHSPERNLLPLVSSQNDETSECEDKLSSNTKQSLQNRSLDEVLSDQQPSRIDATTDIKNESITSQVGVYSDQDCMDVEVPAITAQPVECEKHTETDIKATDFPTVRESLFANNVTCSSGVPDLGSSDNLSTDCNKDIGIGMPEINHIVSEGETTTESVHVNVIMQSVCPGTQGKLCQSDGTVQKTVVNNEKLVDGLGVNTPDQTDANSGLLSKESLNAGAMSLTRRVLAITSSEKRVLPVKLVQQVAQVTREKVVDDPRGIVHESPFELVDEVSVSDSSVYQSSSDYDISALFSDSFDKSYKRYVKESKRKAKKRKASDRNKNESKQQLKKTKVTPNYFLAIQVNDNTIHRNAEVVQQYMLSVNSGIEKALINVSTLHLTLMVLSLQNQDDIDKACAILEKCEEKLSEFREEPLILDVKGIGNFRDEVVFANTDKVERLQKLADIVANVYAEKGMISTDKRGFKPHITMLKLSKAPALRRKGIKKVGVEYYEPYTDCTFGTQVVQGVQLCAMLKRKDSQGYYHVEKSIPCVPEHFSCTNKNGSALLTLLKPPAIQQNRGNHTLSQPLQWTVQLEKEITWTFHPGNGTNTSDESN